VDDLADAVRRLDLTWHWVCSLGEAERAAAFESVRRAAPRANAFTWAPAALLSWDRALMPRARRAR
jgi:hypothetical protein